MKKIVFLINTLSVGGAERILINIVNNLDTKKFDITIKTILHGDDFLHLLSSDIKHEQLIKSKNLIINTIVYKLFSKIVPGRILHKLIIRNEYDIEVSFLEGLPTKIISSSPYKSKKIAWVHTDLLKYRGSDYCFNSESVQKNVYLKFNKIFCVSNTVCEAFKERFGALSSLEVIYNPIDEKNIIEKSLLKDKIVLRKSESFLFVSVGRLVEQKGFLRLINVIGRLRDEGINCEVLIVGEGKLRKEMEELIESQNLNNYVTLIGYTENPYTHIKCADAYVLSSYVEGYPSVIIESLILNIPVIATNCAGVPDILANDSGLIVENSTDDLYEGMKKFILNSETYTFYKNKAKIRGNEFKLEENIKKIEETLYE